MRLYIANTPTLRLLLLLSCFDDFLCFLSLCFRVSLSTSATVSSSLGIAVVLIGYNIALFCLTMFTYVHYLISLLHVDIVWLLL